ncbi:MAG: hypothetical protein ACLFPX_02300 [Candidatus Omnitrophota bacterium]
MTTKFSPGQFFSLLRSAVQTIIHHPLILYPFTILFMLQLFIMEILFFAPRYPLSQFFSPVISRLAGEQFLHYPLNFMLLNRWFQSIQIPFYLFVSSFFIGAAVYAIYLINRDENLNWGKVFKRTLKQYIHLVVAAAISVGFVYILSWLYSLLVQRALQIRSTAGIYFMIKKAVILGAPYANLLFSTLIITMFAFVIPIIMIEGKKVFSAFAQNFKVLGGVFWMLFLAMLASGLFYLPVLLLRSNAEWGRSVFSPEMWQILMIAGVALMLVIDAVQYTAITMTYLLKKDAE